MSPDEQRIIDFLKRYNDFLSARQVGFAVNSDCANPTWAQPCLVRLTKSGILEMNAKGEFRFKRPKSDVAPDVAKLLPGCKVV